MNRHTTPFPNYAAARQYLEPFAQISGLTSTPQFALQRAKALMSLLGSPQDATPVIHIAGTSGKGSTSTMLTALLHSHGLRVGLGLSPHVRHLLERIQINGVPVSEELFCHTLGRIVPAINTMQSGEWGAPSFFEILIALSYAIFAQEMVDVVVMETGLGGRYDATNTVTSADKIALFTGIGFDHVDLLGNTLAKIAAQKAGIIQPYNRVLSCLQPYDAQEVLEAECAAKSASLTIFDPSQAVHVVELHPQSVTFDLTLPNENALPDLHPAHLHWANLHLSLAGAHQAENAGLAVTAAQHFLTGIGRSLDENAVRFALAHVTIPGRMEQRQWRGATFVIDGAHNAQKMHALCSALAALYPNRRFTFIVALKQGKDYSAIFEQILPLAGHLILTRFENTDQGMPLVAADPGKLAALLAAQSQVAVTVQPTISQAMSHALTLPHQSPIIITGSLYMLAEVYAVLDGQTPSH